MNKHSSGLRLISDRSCFYLQLEFEKRWGRNLRDIPYGNPNDLQKDMQEVMGYPIKTEEFSLPDIP